MTKLFVIPGHGAGDPGACGNGYSEAERVRALAQRIKDFGGDSVILGDFSRNYYADGGINYLQLDGDTCIVELHMDSADDKGARGGHVIIQEGIGGPDDWDESLAALMSRIFPGRANTIVERGDLANPWRASNRGYNYRLVENGFISNAGDVATFNSRIDEIAQGYLAAFGIGVGEAPAPAPAPAPEPSPDIQDQGSVGEFEAGAYRCTVDGLRVRSAPNLSPDSIVRNADGSEVHYDEGEIVNLDAWYTIADGWVWGRYTSYTGQTRYIAVGKPTGKAEPDDFLILV